MFFKKIKHTLTRKYDLLPGGYLVDVVDYSIYKFI